MRRSTVAEVHIVAFHCRISDPSPFFSEERGRHPVEAQSGRAEEQKRELRQGDPEGRKVQRHLEPSVQPVAVRRHRRLHDAVQLHGQKDRRERHGVHFVRFERALSNFQICIQAGNSDSPAA